MQQKVNKLIIESEKVDLNKRETKLLTVNTKTAAEIQRDNTQIKKREKFIYLDSNLETREKQCYKYSREQTRGDMC